MLSPAKITVDQTIIDVEVTRRDDVQGLRALAVMAVVCFHAGLPLPGGFVGVDVFFVISGFVITAMLQREWAQRGAVDLPRFYFRRFKRLMPALSLLVSITILLSALLLSPLGSEAKVSSLTGVGAVLMTANAVIATKTGGYFGVSAEGNPLLNTWSLSVEEQFYVFFPVVLIAGFWAARRGKSWAAMALVGFLGAVSLAGALYVASGAAVSGKVAPLFGFYSPVSRAWEFAAGALLALAGSRLAAPSGRTAGALALAGLTLIGLSLFLVTKDTPFPGPMTLLPVLGTVAVIYAGQGANVITRRLGAPLMVYVGDISYSWYLWHWPFVVFASVMVGSHLAVLTTAAVLSLLPAIASYQWVESPLRQLGPMRRARACRFIMLTLLPPLAVCCGLLFANSMGFWSDKIRHHQATIDAVHAGNAANCGQGYVPSSPADPACLWNPLATGAPIYLVGDSNADHFSEPVISAGEHLGRPVKIFTKGGCAFLGRSWSERDDAEQAKCLAFVDGSLNLLDRSPQGVVILGLSDSIWRASGSAVGPARSSETADPKITVPYLQAELTATVTRIQRAGHRVVMLQPIPKFVTPDNKLLFDSSKCMAITVMLGECPTNVKVTAAYQDEIQRDAREAIAKTARLTGARLLDFRVQLCPAGQCSNYGPDGLLYRDAGHLNVEAARSLSSVVLKAVAAQ